MEIVGQKTVSYLRSVADVKDELIEDMRAFSRDNKLATIGTLGGQLCAQVAVMIGARQIFEVGSRFGYSLIWMGRALGPDAQLHFTQQDESLTDTARGFFKRAGIQDSIVYHNSPSLEALKEQAGPFDLILLNLSKAGCNDALPVIHERLRQGGVLITTNTLMSGRVFKQTDDADVQAAQIFNHTLARDPGFMTTVNPLRSGISVSVKIA